MLVLPPIFLHLCCSNRISIEEGLDKLDVEGIEPSTQAHVEAGSASLEDADDTLPSGWRTMVQEGTEKRYFAYKDIRTQWERPTECGESSADSAEIDPNIERMIVNTVRKGEQNMPSHGEPLRDVVENGIQICQQARQFRQKILRLPGIGQTGFQPKKNLVQEYPDDYRLLESIVSEAALVSFRSELMGKNKDTLDRQQILAGSLKMQQTISEAQKHWDWMKCKRSLLEVYNVAGPKKQEMANAVETVATTMVSDFMKFGAKTPQVVQETEQCAKVVAQVFRDHLGTSLDTAYSFVAQLDVASQAGDRRVYSLPDETLLLITQAYQEFNGESDFSKRLKYMTENANAFLAEAGTTDHVNKFTHENALASAANLDPNKTPFENLRSAYVSTVRVTANFGDLIGAVTDQCGNFAKPAQVELLKDAKRELQQMSKAIS
jgi:hypothetical protein